MRQREQEVEYLLGKTVTKIVSGDLYEDKPGELVFHLDNGARLRMYHEQDCCESVYLEDVVGDLDDLVGTPILEAECARSKDLQPGQEKPYDGFTWTFYKIGTNKGSVTLRWYGTSNGYYSEEMDIEVDLPE
jgi:hypothetical protein